MGRKRRSFSSQFRAQVTLEAIRGEKTVNQIASEFDLHPVQVTQWKKRVLEGVPSLLEDRGGRRLRVTVLHKPENHGFLAVNLVPPHQVSLNRTIPFISKI